MTECRVEFTRKCPKQWEKGCSPQGPCARFESNDETPWLKEMIAEWAEQLSRNGWYNHTSLGEVITQMKRVASDGS